MSRRVYPLRAFTLIELLAVIAIITLLIGILVPAIGAARDQAKKTATAALLKSLGTGNEMFHGEMSKYPQSSGINPFTETGTDYLAGAQWLAIQLAGPDLSGFVKPITRNDTNADAVIDKDDWNNWYALNSDFNRIGPFVERAGEISITAERYMDKNPGAAAPPDQLGDSGADWSTGRIPFFVDSFNFPILYYRANEGVKEPFTTATGSTGRYDQSDNAVITGSEGNEGRDTNSYEGWDLIGYAYAHPAGANVKHPIGVLGWQAGAGTRNDQPEPNSFAGATYDQNIYETTRRPSGGRVWPHQPETFILISPGKDGLYGTNDDVRNFNE